MNTLIEQRIKCITKYMNKDIIDYIFVNYYFLNEEFLILVKKNTNNYIYRIFLPINNIKDVIYDENYDPHKDKRYNLSKYDHMIIDDHIIKYIEDKYSIKIYKDYNIRKENIDVNYEYYIKYDNNPNEHKINIPEEIKILFIDYGIFL